MRRFLILLSALTLGAAVLPQDSLAQNRDRGGKDEEAQSRAKEKAKEEWADGQGLALEKRRAMGSCPLVKILYDAARFHEFAENKQLLANVAWTGEISGVASDCAYKAEDPITVEMQVGFALGKGPRAEGDTKTYRWWVAVTDKDRSVLAKEYYDLPVRFAPGSDRMITTQTLRGITIPRAAATVSGENFEILVGFDVTPAMVEFNRDGKRYPINAVAKPAQ
jgi:hypothetical protein